MSESMTLAVALRIPRERAPTGREPENGSNVEAGRPVDEAAALVGDPDDSRGDPVLEQQRLRMRVQGAEEPPPDGAEPDYPQAHMPHSLRKRTTSPATSS